MYLRLPLGWAVSIQAPRVHRPNSRNWFCQSCGRAMRVEKMTREGRCPRCGGRVKRDTPLTTIVVDSTPATEGFRVPLGPERVGLRPPEGRS